MIQITAETARMALWALYHQELSVRPWAQMKDEDEARATLSKILHARAELMNGVDHEKD